MNDFKSGLRSDFPDRIQKLKEINRKCIDLFRDFPSSSEVSDMVSDGGRAPLEEIFALSEKVVDTYYSLREILRERNHEEREDFWKNEELKKLNAEFIAIESVYNLCDKYMTRTDGGRGINGELLIAISEIIEDIMHNHSEQEQNKITMEKNRYNNDDGGERGGGSSKGKEIDNMDDLRAFLATLKINKKI